jgi:hypothetical protein
VLGITTATCWRAVRKYWILDAALVILRRLGARKGAEWTAQAINGE